MLPVSGSAMTNQQLLQPLTTLLAESSPRVFSEELLALRDALLDLKRLSLPFTAASSRIGYINSDPDQAASIRISRSHKTTGSRPVPHHVMEAAKRE